MLDAAIDTAVECIHSGERSKAKIAKQLAVLRTRNLREFGSVGSEELLEEKFVTPVGAESLNCRIAGVDSGFVGKSLASVDFTLVRAVAVVAEYRQGKLAGMEYHPAIYRFPVPFLSNNALEKDEYNCSKSLLRLREEVRVAQEVIERFSPEYCFIDGSIVPQYADKPRKDSKIKGQYEGILSDFQRLYETAEKNKCDLVACVEDSRGSRFRSIVQEEILGEENWHEGQGNGKKGRGRKLGEGIAVNADGLGNVFDSGLLDYVLSKGERGFAFRYTKSIKDHPILMDYDEKWGRSIYAFYMKPAELDRPLRVEVVWRGDKEKGNVAGGGKGGEGGGEGLSEYCDKIAGVVYALSGMHREYAYPVVLIEADLRARLMPDEVDTVFNRILDRLGKRVKIRMRRDLRPF